MNEVYTAIQSHEFKIYIMLITSVQKQGIIFFNEARMEDNLTIINILQKSSVSGI